MIRLWRMMAIYSSGRVSHRSRYLRSRERALTQLGELGYEVITPEGFSAAMLEATHYYVKTPTGSILLGPLGNGFPSVRDAISFAHRHRESPESFTGETDCQSA